MEDRLSFKVYLMNDESSQEHMEVRRFCVDVDVANNFIVLLEKLQIMFPNIRGKNFTVTWKDDSDIVTISTNEEFQIALKEMSKRESINKLYIFLQHEKREIPDISKTGKRLHPGVICDVCEENIHGFRFKCMQCPDYDLCTDCMFLGYHPEHYMVRMTEPLDWSSYHGRRLAHHMRKFMKKAVSPHRKDDESRRYSHKSGGNKRGNCPVFNMAGGKVGFDPSVVDSIADFVKSMYVPLEESCRQKRAKEQRRDPSAEAATEATEDPQQEATRHSFSQLLKIVEDNITNISQFLDPLGINVIVTADNDNVNKNNKPTESMETEPSEPPKRPDANKFPGEGKKLCEDSAPVKNEDASASASKDDVNAEQAAEAEEWTMVGRESPNISRTSSTSSSLNRATSKQIPPPSAPVPETNPQQNIYPDLPPQEFFHPNPKIQHAVETMMSMGFSNESGWLTHLLVSKDGDISKALDVLQPVRFNK